MTTTYFYDAAVESIWQDLAIVPIQEGLEAIRDKGWDYRLARVVTQDESVSFTTGAGDASEPKIGLPKLPPSLLKLSEDAFGFDPDAEVFLNSSQELSEAALTGKYGNETLASVLMPQPYASLFLLNHPEFKDKASQSVSQLKEAENSSSYATGLFVKASLSKDPAVDSYLRDFDETLMDLALRGGKQTAVALNRLGEDQSTALFGLTAKEFQTIQMTQASDGTIRYQDKLGYLSEQPTLAQLQNQFGSQLVNQTCLLNGVFK